MTEFDLNELTQAELNEAMGKASDVVSSSDNSVTIMIILGSVIVGYIVWKIALAMLSSISRAIQGK